MAATATRKPRKPAKAKAGAQKPKADEKAKRSGDEGGGGGGGAARSMWTGSISFGLVNIPVRLHAAVREQRVAFHQLHDQDKVRLRRKLVSSTSGAEVHPEHIVKGFEISKDRFIVVRADELENCAPEKTKAIEITDFVDLTEIDPVYYDRPYYVLPQAGAAKSYRLLVEAMRRTGKVGVARFVFHEKEYLAALRPVGAALCLETMHFGDEVVATDDIDGIPRDGGGSNGNVPEREAKALRQTIESLAADFEPARYRDPWRDCVRKMVERKVASEDAVVSAAAPEKQAPEKKAARATDLMAALEASLARAKSESATAGRNGAADGPHPHPSARKRRKSA